MNLNQVVIGGNLTSDPELKYLSSGTPVCNFSLALNSKQKTSSGEYREEVSFINIVAFGKTGENVAEYLSKGSRAIVTGRLKQERWEKDGRNFSAVKVIAAMVTFLDKKGGKGSGVSGHDHGVGHHQDEEVY